MILVFIGLFLIRIIDFLSRLGQINRRLLFLFTLLNRLISGFFLSLLLFYYGQISDLDILLNDGQISLLLSLVLSLVETEPLALSHRLVDHLTITSGIIVLMGRFFDTFLVFAQV